MEPMEPRKCNHRRLRGASFHTRRGSGLREFINKLPQKISMIELNTGFDTLRLGSCMFSFAQEPLKPLEGGGQLPSPCLLRIRVHGQCRAC